jgi:hypothetical protein
MIAIRPRRGLLQIAAMTFLALAVAGHAAPPLAVPAPPRQSVAMRLASQEGAVRKLGHGNCQWLELCDGPQERLLAEPKFKSTRPIYYAARYGEAKDSLYSMVLDESNGPGRGYDVLYVDANNDNRIDAAKERFPVRVGDLSQTGPIRICLRVCAGGVTAPYDVTLSAFEYCDAKFPIPGIHITLRDSSYYVGEAVFGGKTRKIAVADLNANGLFNDVEHEPFQGDRFYVASDDGGQFYGPSQ